MKDKFISKTLEDPFQAINMKNEERKHRMRTMRRIGKKYDVMWWTKMFLNCAFAKELKDFPIMNPPQTADNPVFP